MPELPEVETVRLGLNSLIIGKVIETVKVENEKSFTGSKNDIRAFVEGATISSIRRRAKLLILELSSNYSLIIHLKMTGQLVYRAGNVAFGAGHPSDSLIGKLPDKSTRVVIKFQDDSKLFFNDQRKFGWIKLYPTVEVPNIDFLTRIGPEPLADDFNEKEFIERLMRRKKSVVKAVLLDQTVIAGVGNIYADESLFAAKIHPLNKVEGISETKLINLFRELKAILNLSILKGGSSDRNYVNAKGIKGSYLTFAKVFRKEGTPCTRCGHEIIKIRAAGRGTHICTNCQKLPSR